MRLALGVEAAMATLKWEWLPRTHYWKTHDRGVSETATAYLSDGKRLFLHSTANGEWFLELDESGKRTKLGGRLGYNVEAEPDHLRRLMELRGIGPVLTRREAEQAAEKVLGTPQVGNPASSC